MTNLLYGKSPILETLRAGRRKIQKFYYSSKQIDATLKEALQLCQLSGSKTQHVDRSWIEGKLPNVLTQGWVAELEDYPYVEVAELQSLVRDKADSIILALDQIQDPQNLGAILRSAECCGVDGVLIPADHSTHVTPVVCKASAGAVEHLRISLVTNLTRSLKQLQEAGFWIVGTSVEASETASVQDGLDFQWPEKTLLILGSEEHGLRRLTKDTCDFLVHLPLLGKIQSLNVAATAAVCLYQILRTRKNSKK